MLAIFVLIFLMITLVIIFMKIKLLTKLQSQKSIREFNSKFSNLTEGLKDTHSKKEIYFWRLLSLLRSLLTLILLVTLNNMPAILITVLLVLSLCFQLLQLVYNPYSNKTINYLSLFNEVAVSVYLYLALLLTDYTQPINADSSEL